MPAQIIDGKAVAARVRAEVAAEVTAFTEEHGRPPGLATILVGDDAASAVYVGGKQKASAEVGIEGFSHKLAGDVPEQEVAELIEQLNADERVSGILCQASASPASSTPGRTSTA
jgi:methylenetetrahydrofolate dehydrogenase (NADP+)/methenyltetrahydrofolate cyclohydrolase